MSARASRRRRRQAPVWLAVVLVLSAVGHAEEAPEAPAAAGEGPPTVAPIALERLLKLPDSLDYSVPSRAGITRPEWRVRFESLRRELEEERQQLEEAQAKLEKAAGSVDAWQVGPAIPGVEGGVGDAPLDYRLRQQIRRHRDAIQHLERQLRALEVEANLVSVPPDWRE